MELNQIETFLAVATFGGFHRAAEALRISQPAVSARIKALEQSLRVKLFTRSRSGLTVSEAGRIFKSHAEEILRTASVARQSVQELQTTAAGPLQIAAGLSICVYFLPDVLKRFNKTYPSLTINLRSGHSKEVLDMVLSGQAEIGLARSLNHPEIETLSLRDDPLLLVAHPNHSPKGIRKARLEEVANWPLIFYERGSSDWTLTHSLFRRAGLLPNVALEVDTIETAKRMVERELGMAFLPQLAVVNEIRAGKLCTLQIPDEGTLRRSLDAIHPRHRPLRPEALAFLKVVQDAANESSAITRKAHRLPVNQRKKQK